MMDDDLRTIRVDEFLPHAPGKVWRALTEPDDLSSLDSTVTFTLEPEGSGTRLFLGSGGRDQEVLTS